MVALSNPSSFATITTFWVLPCSELCLSFPIDELSTLHSPGPASTILYHLNHTLVVDLPRSLSRLRVGLISNVNAHTHRMIDSLSSPAHLQSQGSMCSPSISAIRARKIRWWLLGGTGLSILLSYVSVSRCSFMFLDFGETTIFYDPVVLGLFNMAIADEDGNLYGCIPQNGDERFKDGIFGVGRTFGVLTAIITTFNFLLAGWILLFMRPDWADHAWRYLQGLIMTALICQLTTFAVFGSSVCTSVEVESFGTMVTVGTECLPGVASAFGGINVILLIIVISLACVVPAPVHPYFIRWVDDEAWESQHERVGSFQDGDNSDYPDKNDSTDDDDDDYYDSDDHDEQIVGRSMDPGSEAEDALTETEERETDSMVFT